MSKILVVDDSSFMQGTLADLLSAEGYEVSTCSNGAEALEKISADKPALILLDLIMPELDGIGFLKKMGSEVKVIVISAIGQEKMLDEAKTLGVLDYIVKPFDDKMVLAAVKTALA